MSIVAVKCVGDTVSQFLSLGPTFITIFKYRMSTFFKLTLLPYFFNYKQKMAVQSLKKHGQKIKQQVEIFQKQEIKKWAVSKYWKENFIL